VSQLKTFSISAADIVKQTSRHSASLHHISKHAWPFHGYSIGLLDLAGNIPAVSDEALEAAETYC